MTPHWVWLTFITILGANVGSFLNVVIYRLPVMMEAAWKSECRALLEDAEPAEPADL